jgi:hypothetical protein
LGGCNITGSIPASFGDLFNLQKLWLNDNELTGEIPDELGRLMALETLEVEGNNLTGDFPEAICSLKAFGYLDKLGADCTELQVSTKLSYLLILTMTNSYKMRYFLCSVTVATVAQPSFANYNPRKSPTKHRFFVSFRQT